MYGYGSRQSGYIEYFDSPVLLVGGLYPTIFMKRTFYNFAARGAARKIPAKRGAVPGSVSFFNSFILYIILYISSFAVFIFNASVPVLNQS